jgi:hypothetical protein
MEHRLTSIPRLIIPEYGRTALASAMWVWFTPITMKTLGLLLSAFFILHLGASPSLRAQDSDVSGEPFGKLALEQKAVTVLQHLGEPKSKGENVLMEATGEWVQEWRFPASGLTIMMGSTQENGAKTVWSITADKKCQLATARGIRIASTEAEVMKAYIREYQKEESETGKTFVAGSIYGGVIFGFKKGKVTQIFIGSAAE